MPQVSAMLCTAGNPAVVDVAIVHVQETKVANLVC